MHIDLEIWSVRDLPTKYRFPIPIIHYSMSLDSSTALHIDFYYSINYNLNPNLYGFSARVT